MEPGRNTTLLPRQSNGATLLGYYYKTKFRQLALVKSENFNIMGFGFSHFPPEPTVRTSCPGLRMMFSGRAWCLTISRSVVMVDLGLAAHRQGIEETRDTFGLDIWLIYPSSIRSLARQLPHPLSQKLSSRDR